MIKENAPRIISIWRCVFQLSEAEEKPGYAGLGLLHKVPDLCHNESLILKDHLTNGGSDSIFEELRKNVVQWHLRGHIQELTNGGSDSVLSSSGRKYSSGISM
jgi:hypothetical protein